MKFNFYKPKPGHPDFEECLQKAKELERRVLPVITKDADLTRSDRLQDLRRKAKAVKKHAENYYINRKRYRAGDHALRPLYAIWTMLNDCNFRCTYCDNHQGKHYFDVSDPDRLDTEQSKRLLDLLLTGSPALYWCGGEPTMRNDLPELLDYAWDAGFFPNMINTNGSLFHQRLKKPGWKDFLRKMDIVIVSLDALNTRLLNELWGVKKAKQVYINLLLLRELKKHVKFKLSVNTVITENTIDECRDVLDLTCDLDLWFVPVPVNYKHKPSDALLNDPAYRDLANLIIERKKQGHKIIGSTRLLKAMLFCEPHTCYTALKPHVWSNGSICWPCRASVNVKPVDINLLEYHSFDQAYEAGRKLINPNFFCGMAKNQCGGECAWMQNYTTSRYMEGVIDPLHSGMLSEIHEFALDRRNW